MVIDDFDVVNVAIVPTKAYAPPVVDSDAIHGAQILGGTRKQNSVCHIVSGGVGAEPGTPLG